MRSPSLRENITLMFYYNDPSKKDKDESKSGVAWWWKKKMKFHHVEVAFPMSMYRRNDGMNMSDPSIEECLYAYGVFSDHTDVVRRAVLVSQDKNEFIFHIEEPKRRGGVSTQRLVVSCARGWNDTSAKDFPMPAGTLDLASTAPLPPRNVERFRSRGKVDVMWGRDDRFANRFSKAGQKYAVITVVHDQALLELELPGIVFGKARSFSNPAYVSMTFNVPAENAIMAANFAEKQVGKPHDSRGTYRALFFPSVPDYKSYYCVNLAASVIQIAGIIDGINPNFLLPDHLYALVEKHPDRITSVTPYAMAQAWANIDKPRVFSASKSHSYISRQKSKAGDGDNAHAKKTYPPRPLIPMYRHTPPAKSHTHNPRVLPSSKPYTFSSV